VKQNRSIHRPTFAQKSGPRNSRLLPCSTAVSECVSAFKTGPTTKLVNTRVSRKRVIARSHAGPSPAKRQIQARRQTQTSATTYFSTYYLGMSFPRDGIQRTSSTIGTSLSQSYFKSGCQLDIKADEQARDCRPSSSKWRSTTPRWRTLEMPLVLL
jgi:hypothetical protein